MARPRQKEEEEALWKLQRVDMYSRTQARLEVLLRVTSLLTMIVHYISAH